MDASAWTSVAAAAIALVAAGAAVVQTQSARSQAESAKKQTDLQEQLYRDQQQPYVWADFRLEPVSNYLVALVLKNEGPTIAEDVQLEFDPPIHRSGELTTPLEDVAALSHGITTLTPGREMSWILGSHVTLAQQNLLGRHKVTIRYRGPFGDVEPVIYYLDYADFLGISILEKTDLKDVVRELKKIADRRSGRTG